MIFGVIASWVIVHHKVKTAGFSRWLFRYRHAQEWMALLQNTTPGYCYFRDAGVRSNKLHKLANRSRISRRSTIRSIAPCSSKNSAR